MSYLLFYMLTKHLFSRLEKVYPAALHATIANLHGSMLNRCTMIAVCAYAVFIYVLDIKSWFTAVSFLSQSEFLQSFLAVSLFFIFLIIIWVCAFPSYRHFFNTGAGLKGYISSHVRFNSAIIAPWFIVALIIDCSRLLPPPLAATLSGNSFAAYAFIACLFIGMAVFFPPLLVRLWGCKPIHPGFVRSRIMHFCEKAEFSYAEILEWNLFEGKLITAGVMGFIPKFRYLLISPALLNLLDEQDLEAVVAHEIGHIKRHHMLFYILFVAGYSLYAYIFFSSFFYFLLSQDFIFNLAITAEGKPGPAVSFIGIMILLVFLLVYFRLLFGLFSRNFERQADGYACMHTGSGNGIIQSLEKIALAGSQSRSAPNWHHFSIQERIDFMRRCTSDSSLIKKHDLRVRRLIAAYCAVLLLTAGSLFLFDGSFTGNSELSVLQKITQRRIESEPDNPMLYFLLGNIYFEKNDYGSAERSYLASLKLAPDNAEALNNLAWLYATSEDLSLRNASKALLFARRAAELDPRPHILDTLAESYFVNGDYQQALDTIEEALSLQPSDRPYFEKQRSKFKAHIEAEGAGQSDDDVYVQEGPGIAI
ncbi:MAG: M48 family metalloprotease [Deltaproteobacteria bacterium]|nr:M48 family metalloprotease [Deltaproteobacteria bacterium]